MFIKNKNFIPVIIIIIAGIIPLSALFHSGLPLTHDGQDHVARIANFYQSISEGNFIPRWGGNLNWGYGHPVMMFLYPLPSYIASIFHFLGFSLVDSVKIVFGLGLVLSGVGMYLWIGRFLGVYAGIIASLLYMFAPYRFVNLYVRGAIGEHISFVFIPFVLFFITRLFLGAKSKTGYLCNFLGISVFTGMLILSHNALSILFLSFTFVYSLILFLHKRDKLRIAITFGGIFYGFLLSAFFWAPAYLEGKYTLRDIVTGGAEYADRFVVTPLNFLIPSWSYGITGQLSVQIGIVHISLILLGIYVVLRFYKKKILEKRTFILTFVFFILSLFMMLRESNFIWSTITTLQKFQFPWRFLSLTVLTSAVLGSYFVTAIINMKKLWFLIISIFILITIFYSSYWKPSGYLIKEESFFKNIYHSTTDTGESSPLWSVRFMEKEPDDRIEVIEGDAKITEISRTSTKHTYHIKALERSRIKENTLYFPGWNVYINDRKLDVNSEIQFQDEMHRGIMTFFVETGENNVELVFEDTKIRSIADLISTISFVFLFILIIKYFLLRQK